MKNIDVEGDFILSRFYVVDIFLFFWNNDIKFLILMLGDVKEEGKFKCLGGERGMFFDIFLFLFVFKKIVIKDWMEKMCICESFIIYKYLFWSCFFVIFFMIRDLL